MQNNQNGQNLQKQQMSEEELQRTQVLNFDTFKQVARYEKVSSKKPAIVVALIGILAIIIGGSYPIVQSQMEKNNESKSTMQARKKDNKLIASELTCTQEIPAGVNGLDQVMKINYNFIDNKLTSFTKELTLTISPASTTGTTSLQSFITALQPYLVQKDGYSVVVRQIENGVVTTTSVDYRSVDINTLPEINQKNNYFSVVYLADTNMESIKQDMTTQNYICN